jgi:hypothetical protein
MKIFRARICKQETLIRTVVFCLGLFIASSPLRAQSSKASTSVPAKRSALDNSFDPLQQVSTSLQMLPVSTPCAQPSTFSRTPTRSYCKLNA